MVASHFPKLFYAETGKYFDFGCFEAKITGIDHI